MTDQSDRDAAEDQLDGLRMLMSRTTKIVEAWGDQPVNGFSTALASLWHANPDVIKLFSEYEGEWLRVSSEDHHKVFHPDTGQRIA
jgi:hypothetical protein